MVLADVTLEELDNLKTRPADVGANAREANRILEEMRQAGNLVAGVKLQNGGLLRVEVNHLNCELPAHWDSDKADNRILKVCKGIAEDESKKANPREVILVTQDIAVRLKAVLINVRSEEYRADSIAEEAAAPYTGRALGYTSADNFRTLHAGKPIAKNCILDEKGEEITDPVENEFFTIQNLSDSSQRALVQYKTGAYYKIRQWDKSGVYGVTPRNAGQSFAMEALMSPASECPLVIMQGAAGTAKTFLSLAAALENVVDARYDDRQYNRILVVRPNVKFDDTVGFLKGTEEDKVAPLMRPIMDNLEILTQYKESGRQRDEQAWQTKKHRKKASGTYNTYDDNSEDKFAAFAGNSYVQELFEDDIIVAQAMEYMRGRSIPNTYIIIDEAQNMSPTQAFGIISRAGIGSKIILCGDPDQIDNPRLDKRTNGLSYAAACMKGSKLCAQIRFNESECVRSALAKEAVDKMSPKGYAGLAK